MFWRKWASPKKVADEPFSTYNAPPSVTCHREKYTIRQRRFSTAKQADCGTRRGDLRDLETLLLAAHEASVYAREVISVDAFLFDKRRSILSR